MMPGRFELPVMVALLAASCVLSTAVLRGQAGGLERTFCEPGTAQEFPCTEDAFAISFEPQGEPVVELADFNAGRRLEASVILDSRSDGVQGWAFGVAHDPDFLSIESVTFEGTDAAAFFDEGFQVTSIARCTSDPCNAGFISAIVLKLDGTVVLPPGRNSVAAAVYSLLPRAVEASEAGLLLELQSGLIGPLRRPVDILITVNREEKRPRTLVDGWIRLARRPEEFHRGDPNGDGLVAIGDAVGLVLFLFLLGPSPVCLEAGDADDTGRLDTTDPILILQWLFLGGTAPAPPGPPPSACGPDPQGGGLGCDTYDAC